MTVVRSGSPGILPRLLQAALVLSLACLGAACGDSWRPESLRTGPHWRLDSRPARVHRDATEPRDPECWISPPDAHNARFDLPPDPPDRFVLNLLPGGAVYFKTYEFQLDPLDPEARSLAAHALEEALEEALRVVLAGPVRAGTPAGTGARRSPVPVMLHAHGDCAWDDLVVLIHASSSPRVRTSRLQLAVRQEDTRRNRRMDADLVASGATGASGDAVSRMIIRLGPTSGEVPVRTCLTVGDQSWVFPAGDALDDEVFLTAANALWSQVESHLRGRACPREASIEITDGRRATWAYVVKVLDLLLGRGVLEVTFAADDVRLRLVPPPDPDPGAWQEPRVVDVETVLWCVGASVLALLLCRGGVRGGVRPRSDGSGASASVSVGPRRPRNR